MREQDSDPHQTAARSEPTVDIVRRIGGGDAAARDQLLRRYLPMLRRWAHGRLPASARDLCDTDDLVQVTLMRAINNVGHLRLEHPGSFFVYLKQSVLNGIKNELRRTRRQQDNAQRFPTSADPEEPSGTNLEEVHSDMDAYDQALRTLSKRQQRLLVMRLEFGLSYEEIAVECGSTADAVRMMVGRAVMQIAKQGSKMGLAPKD